MEKLDKKIVEKLDVYEKDRIESYEEALNRLIKKDKEFEKLISKEDIKLLALYEDEKIKDRVEIRALKQERKRMLMEEKEKLSRELAGKIGQGMENSIEIGNAVIKSILLGLFGGPIGILLVSCKEALLAQQTKNELKNAILESIESGNEADVHSLIVEKDREYGKVLNFSGFLNYIKKSDTFHDLKDNKEEKEKIIKSMEKFSREAFELYAELEDYKDEILVKKEQEKFEEDDELEPEIGMKLM